MFCRAMLTLLVNAPNRTARGGGFERSTDPKSNYFESSRTPIDELDVAIRLDGRDSRVHVLRHNVATIEQAHSHVLALTRIAFDHMVRRLEACVRNLSDRHRLVMCLKMILLVKSNHLLYRLKQSAHTKRVGNEFAGKAQDSFGIRSNRRSMALGSATMP